MTVQAVDTLRDLNGHKFRSDIPVQLIKHTARDGDVVGAARVSTQGQHAAMDEGDAGLINFLMKNRHGSPFEHAVMTFRVNGPIFMWREHYRHRIASYNEESGRYKQLEPTFYVPGPDRNLVQVGKPGAYTFVPGSEEQYRLVDMAIRRSSSAAYLEYLSMLEWGVAREVARVVLPLNIYSSAYVTMNARALMNFLMLRRDVEEATFPSHPQREIEMVAEQYEAEWSILMPMTHAAFVKNGRVAP